MSRARGARLCSEGKIKSKKPARCNHHLFSSLWEHSPLSALFLDFRSFPIPSNMDLDNDIHNFGKGTDVDTTQEFHLLPVLAFESLQCCTTAINSINWTKRKQILTKASPLPILKHGSAGKKLKDSLLGLQVLSTDSHNYIHRFLNDLQPRQPPTLTPCFGTIHRPLNWQVTARLLSQRPEVHSLWAGISVHPSFSPSPFFSFL